MKKARLRISQSLFLMACGLIALLFNSCDVYYFSHPQPADKTNVYEFPTELRGVWKEECDSETVTITDRSLSFTNKIDQKIVAGYWPKKDEHNILHYAPSSYFSEHSVSFDSLNNPIDTLTNYVIQKEHIFELKNDQRLGNGYDFYRDKDTLVIKTIDTVWLDLGRNSFIRKVNENFYTLNVLTGTVGENRNWWQVVILEKATDGTIVIWTGGNLLEKSPYLFYSAKNDYYFDCSLSSAELLKMIKRGEFEITNRLTKASR